MLKGLGVEEGELPPSHWGGERRCHILSLSEVIGRKQAETESKFCCVVCSVPSPSKRGQEGRTANGSDAMEDVAGVVEAERWGLVIAVIVVSRTHRLI